MQSGGWIEFQDLLLNLCCDDDTMPQDYVLSKIPNLTIQALKSLDFDADFVNRVPRELESAGFINIRREIFKVPSDLNAMISEAEDALEHIDYHIYVEFGIVYAQKP
ncbi:putative methyltransferase domain-containing protein [Eutypa lata UCREL1]|uniref:Putative methyltransferase domain-containing protein n=1 Tax=Eutypa lata (strain UCR-EL1) TaxID=1287681 RepID=M7T4R7_EUTLA|nr:putative methyltransferase domain-containing protein [Eutypa lata UCREL1]